MENADDEGGAAPDRAAAVDWRAVRLAYEGSAETIPALLQRFGVSAWRLRVRREREEWHPRVARIWPGPRGGEASLSAERVGERLCRLMAGQVSWLEARQQDLGELDDRDVRRILVMARALHLMTKQSRTDKSGAGAKSPASRLDGKNADAGLLGAAGRAGGAGGSGGGGPGIDPASDPRGDAAWARAELKRRLAMLRRPAGL